MTTGFGIAGDIEREEAKRKVVVLTLIILWILVFEGAVRKWFFPALSKPLIFLKDPIVVTMYYLALKHQLFPYNSLLLRLGLGLSVVFIGLAAIQCIGVHLPAAVAAYGWRQYWLVLPLMFVIAETFSGKDLLKVTQHSMIMSGVNAVICIFQSRLPPTHFINSTVIQDAAAFAYGDESIARASGTFSFTFGHEIFTASVLPMILALWLLPPGQRGMRPLFVYLSTVSVLTNVLLDGNRAMFLFAGVTLMACLPGFWLLKREALRWRALLLPGIACVLGGVVYMVMFASAFQAMSSRISNSEDSLFDRLSIQFIEAGRVLAHGNILGEGLGLGSNGGQFIAAGSKLTPIVWEGEWPRVIAETGLLGLAYLLYRCAVAASLFHGAIPATRRTSNMLPLLLISFVLQVLPSGQLAGNATVVYYGWMFAGFAMAANRMKQTRNV